MKAFFGHFPARAGSENPVDFGPLRALLHVTG
jgi:hypothetical protein